MIIIEGIIGVGKSTLCRCLAEYIKRAIVFLEPVDDNPYLKKFYGDMLRWALEMQYFLMARRFKMHQEGIKIEWEQGKTTIFDRSIYGDGAFAYMLHKDGIIDDNGYNSYMQHRECMESFLLIPQTTIFLECDSKIAQKRIMGPEGRNRDCESKIPISYLDGLREAYRTVVMPKLEEKSNVIYLDWNSNYVDKNGKIPESILADIVSKVREINYDSKNCN